MKYNNCLFIVVDALSREYSVILERYFNQIFKNHHTTATWTFPAMHALLTGTPDWKNYYEVGNEIRDKKKYVTKPQLPKLLNGFTEFNAEVSCGWLEPYFGWDNGWDSYKVLGENEWYIGEQIELKNGEFKFIHTHFIHNYFREVEDILGSPRQIKEELRERDEYRMGILRKAYEKRVWQLYRNMRWLKDVNTEETLIILTADHGELFQEDGLNFQHGSRRYNNKLYEIPLMMLGQMEWPRYRYEKTYDIQVHDLINKQTSDDK